MSIFIKQASSSTTNGAKVDVFVEQWVSVICDMTRVGNFYLHVVLITVKTQLKPGWAKTPKTHKLGKIGQN